MRIFVWILSTLALLESLGWCVHISKGEPVTRTNGQMAVLVAINMAYAIIGFALLLR